MISSLQDKGALLGKISRLDKIYNQNRVLDRARSDESDLVTATTHAVQDVWFYVESRSMDNGILSHPIVTFFSPAED